MSFQRTDAVLIQHATAEVAPMLELTLLIHSEYCRKHNFDFWPIFGLTGENDGKSGVWEKNRLLMRAFEAGYRYVVFLDLDTLILPDCPDLRTAVPPGAIGCAWHDAPDGWKAADPTGQAKLYDHHNIGAMYCENTEETRSLLKAWWETDDEGHCWGNQHALEMTRRHMGHKNELRGTWQVFTISRDWNSTPTHPGESPKVLAWHGYGTFAQRMEVMQAAIAEHYPNRTQAAMPAPAGPVTVAESQRAMWQQGIDAHAAGDKLQAAQCYENVLAVEPANHGIWMQYAVLMTEMQEHTKSYEAFRTASGINPHDAQGWHGQAFTLSFLGEPERAHFANEVCLRIAPDMPTARWNRANMRLVLGDFERGWPDYEWGFIARMRPVRQQARPLAALPPEGSPAQRIQNLLVWAEQGMGDTLMMCRLLPELKRRTGATIWFEVQDSLFPLLKDVPGADFVYMCPKDNSCPLPWDEHVSLMSLPYVLGLNEPDCFRSAPYLRADPMKAGWWKEVLVPDKFKVGIAWRGSPSHGNDKYRSTDMQAWMPFKEIEGVSVVPLDPEHNTKLQNWTDTAALIENLDLVICVDTAVAHLAGAMGKPVWNLLPYNNDWRWLQHTETTHWYDSMRLFRQERLGEWGPVLGCVLHELKALLAQRVKIEYAANIPLIPALTGANGQGNGGGNGTGQESRILRLPSMSRPEKPKGRRG